MRRAVAFAFAFVIAVVSGAFYDTFTGKEITAVKYEEYRQKRIVPFCGIEIKECDADETRRMDYSCNNPRYPARGVSFTPFRRMLPAEFGPGFQHRRSKSGQPLPLARRVRTSVMSDGRVAGHTYTHLATNLLLAILGDVTSVHDTANYVVVTTTCCVSGDSDPRCMPVYIPSDDVHLRRSNVRCMNLTRVITYQDLGCGYEAANPERVNTATPLIDLSSLYGNDEPSTRRAKEGRGGRMRTEVINGREWPPSGTAYCIQNERPSETRCHDIPLPGGNGLIGPNILLLWFYRNHNAIARKLEALNPCWDDERIFRETKEINIALIKQMLYYELMPAVLGPQFLLKNKVIFDTYGHINDYDDSLEPQVSIEYVVTQRWFHTMQDGRLKTYDNKGKLLNELAVVELTLRTGILPNNRTIEGITQGFFRQPTAAADHLIDPDMGERVLGKLQFASDVMSIDIMKDRDAGLPPYYKYRKICGLPVPKDFDDLLHWMPQEQVDALRRLYETVEDVELLVGIMSENIMPGATVGPTLACIMVDQLRYWRRADRFWYENNVHPGALTEEQLYQIRKMTIARLICDHGEEVDSIQPRAIFVPGSGNEITDCKNIPAPHLEPWKDESCSMNIKISSGQKLSNYLPVYNKV